MYFFDKKVEYLVWEMQEGHARGIGAVKIVVMDAVCRIEIMITGCGRVQGTYPIFVLSGDMQSLLGEIHLEKGKGSFYAKCTADALGDRRIPYVQMTGIEIDLKTEGILHQKWLPAVANCAIAKHGAANCIVENHATANCDRENRVEEKRMAANRDKENRVEENHAAESHATENRAEEKRAVENCTAANRAATMPSAGRISEEIGENREREEKQTGGAECDVKGKGERGAEAPRERRAEIYPEKWQQLCAIYPIVHPFKDGRAYLSIEPRDFVILQERFHPLAQNSFLLHGFYYYRHLLLGRSRQGRVTQYYLGVPGVFYEKEKSAALFYGFESFESAVTPASEGSFGYYMKRVQL